MINRYFSNEWVEPIVNEASSVLDEFPRERATELAAAVLIHADVGNTHTPWATVFPSDDPIQITSRLQDVLHTPDYTTPAYDPDTHLAFEELNQLLDRHDAHGMQRPHAAYYLVQAAAGKEDELFMTYQDNARLYPQYAPIWRRKLWQQFGSEGYWKIIDGSDRDLQLLMVRSEGLAERHYEDGNAIVQSGESTKDAILRTLDFFDISTEGADVEAIRNVTKILECGLEGYRALAYQVRGLPTPETVE